MVQEKTNSYSALEHYILDTLRNRFRQGATMAELARATALPPGTVRMELQWLLACDDVECQGACYQAVGPR